MGMERGGRLTSGESYLHPIFFIFIFIFGCGELSLLLVVFRLLHTKTSSTIRTYWTRRKPGHFSPESSRGHLWTQQGRGQSHGRWVMASHGLDLRRVMVIVMVMIMAPSPIVGLTPRRILPTPAFRLKGSDVGFLRSVVTLPPSLSPPTSVDDLPYLTLVSSTLTPLPKADCRLREGQTMVFMH